MKRKKIILTGGGTGGHVIPALALVPELEHQGYDISYIGSYTGIERELVENHKTKIPYHAISTGKLRRYLSKENIKDMGRVVKGVRDAGYHMKKIKPDVVFSKGGFVSVPVVMAAWLHRVPVVIHESDASFGLANKISAQFATAICTSFPEIFHRKAVFTGTPIRADLLKGDKHKGKKLTGLGHLPVMLVMGGSGGAVRLNQAIVDALPQLLRDFNVIHMTGRGNQTGIQKAGYKEFEFISDELKDVFALADLVVSRAGANAVFEFLALKKPNLLVPLPLSASRGDQIDNAKSFEKQGYSKVLLEENLTTEQLVSAVTELYKNRHLYTAHMAKAKKNTAIKNIVTVIVEHTKGN